MPQPCTVCLHPDRAEIDRRLAAQIVNVSAVARDYGLHVSPVRRHRLQHLPDFLVALTSEAVAPSDRAIHAELQRVYLTALDALARAEAGTLVQISTVDGKPVYDRIWSPTAVARLIGEARKSLGVISALVSGTQQSAPADVKNAELDAAMLRALARFEERERALGAGIVGDVIVDAEVVDDTPPLVTHELLTSQTRTTQANEQVAAESTESVDTPYAGVPANGGVDESPPPQGTLFQPDLPKNMADFQKNTMAPTDIDDETKRRLADLFLAGLDPEVRQHIAEVISQAASNDQLNPETLRREWPGNPAASLEERTAEGWANPAPIQLPDLPPKPPKPAPPTSSANDRTSPRTSRHPDPDPHHPDPARSDPGWTKNGPPRPNPRRA